MPELSWADWKRRQRHGGLPCTAPTNLTAKATQEKTDAQLRKVIQEGRPGTAMTGYAITFDEEKLADVIAYIRSLKP